jgi:hypothetical protein
MRTEGSCGSGRSLRDTHIDCQPHPLLEVLRGARCNSHSASASAETCWTKLPIALRRGRESATSIV